MGVVEMGKTVKVKFEYEEALACAIALTKVKKPYMWQIQALEKINKALGRTPT